MNVRTLDWRPDLLLEAFSERAQKANKGYLVVSELEWYRYFLLLGSGNFGAIKYLRHKSLMSYRGLPLRVL